MKKAHQKNGFFRKTVMFFCSIALLTALFAFQPVNQARASHEDPNLFGSPDGALDDTAHVNGIFEAIRENWFAAMMMMTEQLVTTMMQQMFILATFLDAQQQLEVQRLLQDLTAQAHKDFHPSFQMCQIGTGVASIAHAEQYGRENTKVLEQALAARETLQAGQASAGGPSIDVTSRIEMFQNIYCDLNENNRAVFLMCGGSSGPVPRRTKDIDYARVVDNPYTLNVNYLDAAPTLDEQDVISLGRNIYAGNVVEFFPEQIINETAGMNAWVDARSLHAIRSVARHSFTKIVGMKAEGDQANFYESAPFIKNVIRQLGVPPGQINDFLGENPSYFAQMEIITRKIYQSPEFFTNLYDKPANVRRIGVSLQAIEIMQDRDRFESALRREMLLSLILELKLRQYQEDVNSILYRGSGYRKGLPNL